MRVAWLIPVLLLAADAAAQNPFSTDPAIPGNQVRQAADEILSSPEFRDLQRLREPEPSSGSSGGRGSPSQPPGRATPRPGSHRPQGSQPPPSGEESRPRDSAEQQAGADPPEEYPDGWRGGVEGGRQSVRPEQPDQHPGGAGSVDSNPQQPPEDAGGPGSQSRESRPAGNAPGTDAGRATERQGADGARNRDGQSGPGREGAPAPNGSGGTRDTPRQSAPGGSDSPREPAGPPSARSEGNNANRNASARAGEQGAQGSRADRPRIRGSNEPGNEGWRGGAQGSRRAMEEIAERSRGEEGRLRNGRSAQSSGRRSGEAGRNSRNGNQASSRSGRSERSVTEDSSPRESTASRVQAVSSPLGSAVASLFHVLAWLMLVAVCAMIVYLIYRAIRDYERAERPGSASDGPPPEDLVPETAPGDVPADVYVARARELAQAGEYREAVAQLLLGAMSHIERNGFIRYRRGLTLRDYLRAARRGKPQFAGMKSMVRVYEPLGFGCRDATREHFEVSLAGYEQGFREPARVA